MATKKIKPYARLLTMLGEQLIKNERVALVELIKNSYDADADWVKVSFNNFGPNYQIQPDSNIVVEDDGTGMSLDIVENHWLNPATPEKKNRKKEGGKTKGGRILQGEKGIGRFAIFKLGQTIEVCTRGVNESKEILIEYDFSKYDEEFLSEEGEKKHLYLDDLDVNIDERKPQLFVDKEFSLGVKSIERKPQGTQIKISNLKGSWTENKVKSIYNDLIKLQSIFSEKKSDDEFDVYIYKEGEHQRFHAEYIEKLDTLLTQNSVLKIEDGKFDSDNNEISFLENGTPRSLKLTDPQVAGNSIIRERFGKAAKELESRSIECGSFNFGFFIFDFSNDAVGKYKLDRQDKNIIKEHRIYLYRDGIRVYPYGEQDDDWLRIDAYRGTKSAGAFLSNDQVVGFVNISQSGNPKLKDKTNREGLIDEGYATEDFITILQYILAYIRQKPYKRYREKNVDKKDHEIFKSNVVEKKLEELRDIVKNIPKAREQLSQTEKAYKSERRYLTQRAETTEELAGVGLSVETASHDIMGMMDKIYSNIDSLVNSLMSGANIDNDELLKELQSLRGGLSFVEAQLKDIQLLFKSSKQRRRGIRVKDVLDKVSRLYKSLREKENISLEVNTIGSPLVAKSTDAVLLQLFLNLFDNSIYWLSNTSQEDKVIEITLDGDKGRAIFSDNGPGIEDEDIPYLFEPFFSGKGEEGRGLGLYIARQLLERHDYSINLADISKDRVLSGANFVIEFLEKE